ncbi:MAG: transporter [Vicingaceae bacterium]
MLKKIISLIALLFSLQAFSQSIQTDRPSQTDAATAVSPGVLQVESGFLFEQFKFANGFSQHRNSYPINVIRLGLLEKLELRMVNQLVSYRLKDNLGNTDDQKVNGSENLQIGFKYQLTNDDSRLLMSAIAHAILPTGSEGINNQFYGTVAKLSFNYSLDDKRSLSSNLGYVNQFLDFESNGLVKYADGDFTYTLVYGHALSDKVGLFLETYGTYQEFNNWQNNMDAGFAYLIKENLQVDYSFGWGINQIMNYHSLGLSFRLPN